jgi:transposase-like protein
MNDHLTISTFQLFQMFPDAESARTYLESRRWPNGPRCPVCGLTDRITTRKGGYYRCGQCKEDFTVRTGTIFERSHVPLHKWIVALGMLAECPEVPSEALATELNVTQKTGWLMSKRIHESAGGLLSELFLIDRPGFKRLAFWPAYRVGEDGSIWTRYRKGRGGRLGLAWREMRPTPDKDGYRTVRLYDALGTWEQLRVSVLVCSAFHGARPEGMECRHLNGHPADDAASNLAWGTSAQNKADMRLHGTAPLGETHHNATLSDAQVAEIRSLKGRLKQREIAEQFGITQGYVSEIHSGASRETVHISRRGWTP